MRKIIAYEFLTIDGYMAGREGQEMDFVTRNFLNEMESDIAKEYKDVDTFLFGRVTYESLSNYWPNVTIKEEPLADLMNNMSKIVFSKTTTDLKWKNSRQSTKKLLEEVEGKNVMIIGSASIVQELTERRLIDEYKILFFPLISGGGKSLFRQLNEGIPLKSIDSKIYNNGVLLLTYSKH
ncbi:dihydrofolate reductase family protein [Zhouia spongiae]|uniref:Dihydrofolate reductase family protein n=1 Tax=Zhouia spongiae TaxID=2202721 RepID=A0ABY3YQ62_9FLAO|nr:dihydrofolate reductase family protein [Zhouia spongiae]UNY99836.1 dihydrofolate reductase family protein [Zhouia spongiae]